MMNARQRIEELDAGVVDERYWNQQNAQNDEVEKFDYGTREISRKPLEVELNQQMPYISLNLCEMQFGML